MGTRHIFLLVSTQIICLVNSSVLLISNKKLNVSPLERFDNNKLANLSKSLQGVNIAVYKLPSSHISPKFENLLHGHHSVFTTKEDFMDLTFTDIPDVERGIKQIQDDIDSNTKLGRNFLVLIVAEEDKREKREISDEVTVETPTDEPPSGAILYRGKSKTEDAYGLLYSASPLQLRINNSVLYLGEPQADLISVDTLPKSTTTRLNVNIPNVDGKGRKITLRFIFTWVNLYWQLESVKISDSEDLDNELKVDKEITAPSRFSYHCTGATVFSDPENDIYLLISNIQVQIDSKTGVFDDAYDCIPFTTVPIWSGLFVSGLLISVLFLSLLAIGDIKTMDKFDNQKTKQLSIAFSE